MNDYLTCACFLGFMIGIPLIGAYMLQRRGVRRRTADVHRERATDRESVQRLIRLLGSPYHEVQNEAKARLIEGGAFAVPYLIEALPRFNWWTRFWRSWYGEMQDPKILGIIAVLGQTADRSAAFTLIEMIERKPHSRSAGYALAILETMGERARPALEQAARSSDPYLQLVAAKLLDLLDGEVLAEQD